MAHIASLVTHYSLAHPAKSFELRHNAVELLNVTPVASLRERVFQVFGSQAIEDLVDLGDHTREAPALPEEKESSGAGPGRFRLRGFVSGPQVQKLNRNSIYLFVNGRLIRDRLLLHALSSAYHNLIPPACYPFALLFLECEAEEVDVNVHPSKTEVRFRHGSAVHDFVRDTIREVLIGRRPAARVPSPAQPAAELPYSEFTQRLQDMAYTADGTLPVNPAVEAGIAGPAVLPEFTLRRPPSPLPRFDFTESAAPARVGPSVFQKERDETTAAKITHVPDTHGDVFPTSLEATSAGDMSVDAEVSLDALGDLRPLGQIHDSFIIAAGRDGLWIIDQHVAHERILFEKVLATRGRGTPETQGLLLPLVIQFSAAQHIEYARIARRVKFNGFRHRAFRQPHHRREIHPGRHRSRRY